MSGTSDNYNYNASDTHSVKIEEYLQALPEDMLSGRDAELASKSLEEMFKLAELGPGDVFYHLGCGSSAQSIKMSLSAEFGADRAIGVDIDESKIQSARAELEAWQRSNSSSSNNKKKVPSHRPEDRFSLKCADIRDVDISDATVVLFWFANDTDLIHTMTQKFRSLGSTARVITIWGPLPGCLPDAVRFPYIISKPPFQRAQDVRAQLQAVFDTDCVDFVTAWEHAERYTKALGPPDTKNDRFLTIIQTLIIWINARDLGIACGDEIPEPITTYVKLMKMNFDIDFEHML